VPPGSTLRTRPPLLVSLLALGLALLAAWYLYTAVGAATMLIGDLTGDATAGLPTIARVVPALVLGLLVLGAIASLLTARGLRRGAGWARIAVLLLALFGLPFGYPFDLGVAGLVVVIAFMLPGPRRFFRPPARPATPVTGMAPQR
jgi:hypothetical protein